MVRGQHDVLLDARLAGRDAFLGAVESNEGRGGSGRLLTPGLWRAGAQGGLRRVVAAAAAKPLSRADIETVLAGCSRSKTRRRRRGTACAEVRSPRTCSTATFEGGRILLVEDDHANQQLVQYVLGKRGYRVDVASNGRCAVDAFAVGNHDAILMDCQMPEMDGYEATRRIRELEASRGAVPILAMTANALGAHRQTCIEAGWTTSSPSRSSPIGWCSGWRAGSCGRRSTATLAHAG